MTFRSSLGLPTSCIREAELSLSVIVPVRNGPWRTTAVYGVILGLYGVGVPIERLDRLYRRLR